MELIQELKIELELELEWESKNKNLWLNASWNCNSILISYNINGFKFKHNLL